jgi:ABC-2 type transport system permease protein
MLKGNGLAEAWPHLWPLLLFLLAVSTLAVVRYRRTLD